LATVGDKLGRMPAVVPVEHQFTSANAREMGRRSAEARKRKREAQRAASADVVDGLRTLAEAVRREDLGPAALAAAVDIIGRVVRGEQSVRDPAEWLRALVDVVRLESGEPTSASVVAHLRGDAVAAVVAARDEARRQLGPALSPTAQAAGEAVVPIPSDVDEHRADEHEHRADGGAAAQPPGPAGDQHR